MASPAGPPQQGVLTVVGAVAKCVALFGVLAWSNYASQLALHPLFGGVTTGYHFRTTWSGAVALLSLIPSKYFPLSSRRLAPSLLGLLTIILSAAPGTSYKWGAFTARFHSPTWSPIAAQLATSIPLSFFGAALARAWLEPLDMTKSYVTGPQFLTFMVSFLAISSFEDIIWGTFQQGGNITSCNIFIALGVLTAVASLTSAAFTPSVKTTVIKPSAPQKDAKVQTAPPVIRTRKFSPVKFVFGLLPGVLSLGLAYNSREQRPCNPNIYPYASGEFDQNHVLAKRNSVTGMITVAENLEMGFRYLRCDHSILGGVWIGERRTGSLKSTPQHVDPVGGLDARGEPLGDSIYSAFVLQEAIRLFERDPLDPSEPKTAESALMIGLGIGTAARAMKLHGISTTIVEIDPVIPALAEEYFNLPPQPKPPVIDPSDPDYGYDKRSLMVSPQIPQTHIQDARLFVQQKAQVLRGIRPIRESMRYDFVMHDCFSGGMVPTHLFTVEFWEDVKTSMKLNGVLAVNFAGKLGSDSSRAILATLEHSFSKCRVYHDRVNPKGDLKADPKEFMNMVFFCTQSPTNEMSLREVTEEDILSSYLRQHVFDTIDKREVTRAEILGPDGEAKSQEEYVLRDESNRLGEWQKEGAVEHWSVMREVLPDSEWEAY